MLRLASALCLLALCTLAALPAAQAQAGANDPKITVTLEVSPKGPTIPLGGMQAFNVNVKLATANIFCTSAGKVTVALALKDTGLPGVVGTLPASVDVPIAANFAPPAPASTTSSGNATARLEVAVAATASADHAHGFTVTANTPATLPQGCQALSSVAPPPNTATAEVTLKTGPAGAAGTGGVSVTAGNCSANVSAPGVTVSAAASCPTTKAAFFLPLQAQVATLLAVGLLRRRVA
ncbi:MAG TPA: hypothetical protein VM241_02350 [Candidatus Thermoplasmatota archaeon]|nr:hypothetical protein [Candidatus Thermoplasmatota archaeon]